MLTYAACLSVVKIDTQVDKNEAMQVNDEHQVWPRESNHLCWHCCHRFEQIPAFLPVCSPTNPRHVRFHGLFCSWNCVKAYSFAEARTKKAHSHQSLITLFAFLTYHRPTHCPDPASRHRHDCVCLNTFKGISMAQRKEVLMAFGGTMSINDFRSGFMIIKDMDMLYRCFPDHMSNMASITSTPMLRCFTYSFSLEAHDKGRVMQYKEKEQKKEEALAAPPMRKRIIRHKTLFD